MKKSAPIVELTPKGVYLLKRANGRMIREKIAKRLYIRAIGRRETDGVTFAQVRFRTIHGTTLTEMFERSYLLPNKRHQIKSRLADLGYEWPEEPALANAILKALAQSRPARRVRIVPAPGWYRSESGSGSVLLRPGQVFAPNGIDGEIIIDPNTHAHIGAYLLSEGSLEGWQELVAKPSRKSTRLRLAIAAAFAAPFLRLLDMDSFGLNLFSGTSDGKTLLLHVAASVDGLISDDGLPVWADSEPALEDQAMGHRDGVVPLDESGDADRGQTTLPDKARMIAFLVARNRPRRLSKQYEKMHGLTKRDYRNIFLSSSERALGAVARASGGQRLGGEEVRLTDVPATRPGSLGIFDGKIKPRQGRISSETSKDLAEALRVNAKRHQGHAGYAFWTRFVADSDGLATVMEAKAWFEEKATIPGAHNAHYRVRSNFALMYAALALGIDYRLLPWSKAATFKAIEACMRDALALLTVGGDAVDQRREPDNQSQLVAQLTKHIAEGTIVPVVLKTKVTDSQAKRRQSADGFTINRDIYLKPGRLRAWFPARSDRADLTGLLKEEKVLRIDRADTATCEQSVAGIAGKPRYYVLNTKALEALKPR
jgi:hypothetical protein